MSAPAAPRARGYDFGAAHAEQIAFTIERYRDLFATSSAGTVVLEPLGEQALASVRSYDPELADEIEGIAEGAGVPVAAVAAINARTEGLACCDAPGRGECSVVVALGSNGASSTAGQTWDWHEELADSWLIWTIEHPGGRTVHTLTEFGIVGKIGVSSTGIGVLLNILHHGRDGACVGAPIHVIARRILDRASDLNEAVTIAAGADVSASSAITLVASGGEERSAVTAELYPGGPQFVLPDERGVLVHTNHFLTQPASWDDREPAIGPDSFFRYEILRRRVTESAPASANELVDVLTSHLGGAGAVCRHPARDADFGARYATLATIALDVERGGMTVHRGGPCGAGIETWSSASAPPAVTTSEGASRPRRSAA